LYDSFVSARDRTERGLADREGLMTRANEQVGKQRQGNTIYVFG